MNSDAMVTGSLMDRLTDASKELRFLGCGIRTSAPWQALCQARSTGVNSILATHRERITDAQHSWGINFDGGSLELAMRLGLHFEASVRTHAAA